MNSACGVGVRVRVRRVGCGSLCLAVASEEMLRGGREARKMLDLTACRGGCSGLCGLHSR